MVLVCCTGDIEAPTLSFIHFFYLWLYKESPSLLSKAAIHTTLLSFLDLCAPLAEERRSPAPTPAEVVMVEARP